jgi:hypothetical protein
LLYGSMVVQAGHFVSWRVPFLLSEDARNDSR